MVGGVRGGHDGGGFALKCISGKIKCFKTIYIHISFLWKPGSSMKPPLFVFADLPPNGNGLQCRLLVLMLFDRCFFPASNQFNI